MFKNPWDIGSENKSPNKVNGKNNDFKNPFKDTQDKIIDFLKFKNGYKNNKGGSFMLFYIMCAILFLLWLSTGFFTVDADEEGVVLRFGKYNREVMPGLHYKLPTPIETVEKLSVTRIKKEMIGVIKNPIGYNTNRLLNSSSKKSEADISYPKESQMLTGDENIIDMHFYVQWKIGNAKNYLFNIKDNMSDNIVRTAAEGVMRQIIGEVSISEALSEKRLSIEQDVKAELQRVLNLYGSGIDVISVGILYSYVGAEVRDAYRDVQSAKADRERFINQAQAYHNEIIPKAKGEASVIVEDSLAYKESVIAKASGDAQKFNEIYKTYSSNKEITKKRMYLDTMESIYKNNEKILIDKGLAKSLLPYLPLGQTNNKKQN
jgi:membrane protease subunit HflK